MRQIFNKLNIRNFSGTLIKRIEENRGTTWRKKKKLSHNMALQRKDWTMDGITCLGYETVKSFKHARLRKGQDHLLQIHLLEALGSLWKKVWPVLITFARSLWDCVIIQSIIETEEQRPHNDTSTWTTVSLQWMGMVRDKYVCLKMSKL